MAIVLLLNSLFAVGAAGEAGPSTARVLPEVKAAFVYNFAKFTDWPPDAIADGTPIVLCVVEDAQTTFALRRLVLGKKVRTHDFKVEGLSRLTDVVRACHVLYAPDLNARSAPDLLGVVGNTPLLTISDYDEFTQIGGVARFVVDGGMLRFVINVAAVQRARLQMSSQLLTLGRATGGGAARD